MRRSLPTKLLLQLLHATPEELAAIERVLGGQGFPDWPKDAPVSQPKQVLAKGSFQAGTQGGPAYVFRRAGRHWEVVWAGGRPFRLRNTLGTRYLNYLLHEPNEPIHAFDLEIAVQPEKGEARVRDSFQPESDPQALREYRQELGRLQAERNAARGAGGGTEVERLEREMESLKSALKGAGAADSGERAFDNVRKALRIVLEQLRSGGPEEQAFAEHLRNHLSIGFECLYTQPQGRIWG